MNKSTMETIKELRNSNNRWVFEFSNFAGQVDSLTQFILNYGYDDEFVFLEHALHTLYKHNVESYTIALKHDGFQVIIHEFANSDIFNVYREISSVQLSGEKLVYFGGYGWFNHHRLPPVESFDNIPDLHHFFEINFV